MLRSQGNNLLGFVKRTNDGNTNSSQIDNVRKEKDHELRIISMLHFLDHTHTLWLYIQHIDLWVSGSVHTLAKDRKIVIHQTI